MYHHLNWEENATRMIQKFHIIGWWTDTDHFMNGNICILECITEIQNHGSEFMHSLNRNVDSEVLIMCHGTVVLIKINTLNMRTPICTVVCNDFPCIITVALLNNRRNEWAEDLCYIREGFDRYGIRKKDDIFVLLIFHK